MTRPRALRPVPVWRTPPRLQRPRASALAAAWSFLPTREGTTQAGPRVRPECDPEPRPAPVVEPVVEPDVEPDAVPEAVEDCAVLVAVW